MCRLNSVATLLCIIYGVQTALVTTCPKRNTYLNIDGNCDAYVECRNFTPNQKVCPDGLNFNQNTKWPEYPCGYPEDVPCVGRAVSGFIRGDQDKNGGFKLKENRDAASIFVGTTTPRWKSNSPIRQEDLYSTQICEPADPTAECPRQFGFFPSLNADGENECGRYRMCVEGKSVDMDCPPGLVFSPDTFRCNWPEQVPSCKANNSFGFKCPSGGNDESGNPIVTNHQYGQDCVHFVSCQNGNARILSCDDGLAFNGVTGRCEDADDIRCGDLSVDAR